ncbi:MAG: hypothetical protein AAF944_17820 [Bacteroidota bacterium]
MNKETVNEIVLTNNNELLLKIIGDGKPMYQYIYREASGVYWDDDNKGFKSTPIKDMSVSEWFFHIKATVKSGLNLDLDIDENLLWKNIPENERSKIAGSNV